MCISCAECENFGQAQREFLHERDRVFSAVASHPEVRPWHLTRLAGFTSVDRTLWRGLYKVMLIGSFILFPALFLWMINMGVGVGTAISAIVTSLTIGAFLGKRIWFPAMMRSEHDRYPQGRVLEQACVSQSERAALVGLGSTIRDWRYAVPQWDPDTSHDGVSLFVAVAFGVSFVFLVGEILFSLVVLAVQTSGTCC